MKNFGDYIYFYYVGNNASYSFRSYTDPETGMESGYVTGYDKNNRPMFKNWEFDNGPKRQVRVHKDEKDREGKLAVDFLRNSPECYKSTNGKYITTPEGTEKQVAFLFREVNEEQDAKSAVDTRKLVIEAQAEALKLKGQELVDIANIIGVFNPNEAVLSHRVLDFASNNPSKFNELLKDPTRKTKALVKKAINDQIFKVEGKIVKWEGKVIGADEDEAVSNIIKDKTLEDAIKLHLKKFGS